MAKKRSHGEGSIYRRSDGRWVAQVTLQGRQLYKYFPTQFQAREWLQETQNQIHGGLTLAAAQISLDEFLREWLEAYKSSIRPKTFAQYEQIVQQYLSPGLGRVKLKELSPSLIQGLYNMNLRSGKSERTVLLVHAVLHSSLSQAVKWGLISRNPAEAVTHPRLRRKEMQTLTDKQVGALFKVAKGSRYEALFWLAITTGLREGEILGLKWSDLDWGTGRLMIQRQLQRLKDQGLVFNDPKSQAGKRLVMVSRETLLKLKGHRVIQQYEKLFAGRDWVDTGLIFPSSIGTPADPRNLFRNFKLFLRNAGLPDIRFHDLRHTAATLMLQQGIHPKVVQERLGHANIMLTLNTYSHVLPSLQKEAAEKMDNLLMPFEADSETN